METFSALLTFCAGNSPVIGEFPAQRSVTRSSVVFFGPNKQLSKQWWGWWFETPSRPIWRHCNESSGWSNLYTKNDLRTKTHFRTLIAKKFNISVAETGKLWLLMMPWLQCRHWLCRMVIHFRPATPLIMNNIKPFWKCVWLNKPLCVQVEQFSRNTSLYLFK